MITNEVANTGAGEVAAGQPAATDAGGASSAELQHPPPTLRRAPSADVVPARMVNEVLYCERLLYLEWAQGEFADNYFTVDGRFVHRRADQPGGQLPDPPAAPPATAANVPDSAARSVGGKKRKGAASSGADDDEDEQPPDPPPYTARSVWLTSERLGLTAKIDVVEGDESGTVVPIEYKRGTPPDVPEGAWLPERAQLCAQVLLLREHGYRCAGGALYFAAARRRVPIAIDDALIATTLRAVARAKELAGRAAIPPPLIDSPKCHGCSLVGICLPDETNLLRGAPVPAEMPAAEEAVPAAPQPLDEPADVLFGEALPARPFAEARRLVPARDDKMPLYVQDQGARIGLDGECLSVRPRVGEPVIVKLLCTSHVCVMGNVQVTTQALRALMERGIPVSFFSTGGWYYGRATGHDHKNVELRMAQWRAAEDGAFCLRMARTFTAAKIRNCRTLLRRNHPAVDETLLAELERLARRSETCDAIESLLGLEGTAARMYFGAFSGMFKRGTPGATTFDLDGRNRRPPRDPVNALLSFCYALLTKDFAVTLSAIGLDPMLGFYHQLRFGRVSLALDLMEEFRPLVADSVVLSAINTGAFDEGDFIRTAGAVAMTPAARKRLIQHYERRMDQLVTHPVFGYRISYRRVLEVQSRLLSRLLLGEITEYPSFRTR